MAGRESIQKNLRVSDPSVQISYDVQVGDAIQLKELPFVLAWLATSPVNPLSLWKNSRNGVR